MLSGEERETNVRTSTRELAIYILFLTVLVIGNYFYYYYLVVLYERELIDEIQ